ncbi:hypothetical protein CKM354_001159800 [Cercospora kikuchii]|uniref:Tetrapyrrole biosynthesis uroporphyrinogen III synthase domain-containing protein n=1 Tax=Cercospora kikuchii TaxID=84275 RepID=A0A9P3CTA2_9PEZI|nr:uroporphyrinogen-III synthase HEM4 [Cercospora kikuchii]GIZ48544.1 hypothetical protein CKM354_001159800 [Cercospora kikuchii]
MDDITTSLQDLQLNQIPVYLLKTPSSPSDSYQEHFSQLTSKSQDDKENTSFKPLFVPVLEHIFRDDALRNIKRSAERFAFAGGSPATARQIATNNPAKRYGGLIFTSQRAVDAFGTVIAKLDPAKLEALFDHEMPIYVVGPATKKGVEALGLPCPILGEETGNGDALAEFILQHHNDSTKVPSHVSNLNGRKLPLLFLVGEQRRDVIPKKLQSEELPPTENIQVMELVVYETGEMATFEEEFTDLIQQAKKVGVKEQWVVVFSPQGCEAMLNALGWLTEAGKFSAGRREVVEGPMKTRVATIGPTTRDHLRGQFGFDPDVCAETPTPEGVAGGIVKFRAE